MLKNLLQKFDSLPLSTKLSCLVSFVCLFFVVVLSYVVKLQQDIISDIQASQLQQKQLTASIVEMQSKVLTKELFEKEIKNINVDIESINKEVARLNGNIYSAIAITSLTPGVSLVGVPSTSTTPIKPPTNQPGSVVSVPTDPFGFLSNVQHLSLYEPIGKQQMPLGNVSFNAQNKYPWSVNILPKKYNTTVILAKTEDDKNLAFVETSIGVGDKTYKLETTQVNYIEKKPESKFRVNPKVMLGVNGGVSTEPGVMLSTTVEGFAFTYGQTKSKSDWYIAGVGVGYNLPNSKPVVSVTPFAYNVTNKQMFSNVNVGPNVSFDVKGNVYVGVGLRLSL